MAASPRPLSTVIPAAVDTDLLWRLARELRWLHYRWSGRLKPRERRSLLSSHIEGFLVFAILETDNPDVTVTVDLYGDGTADIVLSPRRLYELGLVWWSNTAAFVSRYDDDARRYVAVFSPSPWMLFSGDVEARIENPTGIDAHYEFHMWLWRRGSL